MKIGLLGGSFNPAHEGHIYISTKSLEILGLDEIWWLVAKQNPLKQTDGMASFATRFSYSKELTKNYPKIIVSNFEQKQDSAYSFDIIKRIIEEYPQNKFVWLMGADNLVQFKKWHNWKGILNIIPFAVLNRKIDSNKEELESSIADLNTYQIKNNYKELVNLASPSWCYLDIEPNNESSTRIRKSLKLI